MAKRKKNDGAVVPSRREKRAEIAPDVLLDDLRSLIQQTREQVVQAVNSALVLLYWQVGHRIQAQILEPCRLRRGDCLDAVETIER
jgi:hypothetical protein